MLLLCQPLYSLLLAAFNNLLEMVLFAAFDYGSWGIPETPFLCFSYLAMLFARVKTVLIMN